MNLINAWNPKQYTVITPHSVRDLNESEPVAMIQDEIEAIIPLNDVYAVQFENGETLIDSLLSASECLAIKDGVDLVRFDNGNLGLVAYYNDYTDALQIISR